MIFQFAVLLLLPVVDGLISKWTPNRCWLNRNPNEPDIAGVCPLFHKELKMPVYCSINLTPDKIENEKCRRCVWRENTESLCQPTKHWQRRMCCCQRPMCNKQIYEDAMPGWEMTRKERNEYEKTSNGTAICISARYDNDGWVKYGEDNQTAKNYEVVTTNKTSNETPRCFFNLTTKGGRLQSMDMGTAAKAIAQKCEELLSEHDHGNCKPVLDKKTSTTTLFCCCDKPWCNQELYMRRGFDPLMEVRQVAERKYKKQMEDAAKKVPRSIWYNDESYHEIKPTVDGVLIIGTAIYILVIVAAYRLYEPVDMDQRGAPRGAGREH